MSDAVAIALIGAVGSVFTTVMTIILNSVVRKTSEDVKRTQAQVEVLEKNTNSIKDELVKVTGEAEFAKGLKRGTDAVKGAAPIAASIGAQKADVFVLAPVVPPAATPIVVTKKKSAKTIAVRKR